MNREFHYIIISIKLYIRFAEALNVNPHEFFSDTTIKTKEEIKDQIKVLIEQL
jgi:hypothetical protein